MRTKNELIKNGVWDKTKLCKYDFESDVSCYRGYSGYVVYLYSTDKLYRVGTGGTRDSMYEVHLHEMSIDEVLRVLK